MIIEKTNIRYNIFKSFELSIKINTLEDKIILNNILDAAYFRLNFLTDNKLKEEKESLNTVIDLILKVKE